MKQDNSDGLFLLKIDNYYDNPYSIRNYALSCDFEEPFTGTWNGFHSKQRHPDTKDIFFDIAKRIPANGKPNWDEIESSFQFWGRPSAGIFALLLEGQSDTVHFHRRTGTWAGVCYLSQPQNCEGRRGVTFYRHKETGITSCKDATTEQINIFRRDAKNQDCWEEIRCVDMVFNRMVIFDGRYFHAASDGFGKVASEGRLAQLFNMDFLEMD